MPKINIAETITRSRAFRAAVGWGFEKLPFAIPVKRLRETATLLAFYHPKPTYETHILIVPKKAVRDLLELSPEDTAFLQDLVDTTQSLVDELGLVKTGYRLIVNGGEYQEFPQLHFHLVSGKAIDRASK
jgi:histidine triad (HIT) family protein